MADVLRSQRFLAPVLLYGAVLAVLFRGDPGAPPAPWAASALAVYPVSAWLALVVADTENPVQRTITVVAAGGRHRVFAGVLLAALAVDAVLVAMSVLWPILLTAYSHPWPVVLAGVLAHTACAGAGTAVGLLCGRTVVPRLGWALCLAVTVVVVTAVQPWLPPVGTAVAALSRPDVPLAGLAVDAGLGLLLAGGAAAVVTAVSGRR